MQQARALLLPVILATGSLFCSSGGYGAEAAKASYASEIAKDVREDKVYLLENIRHKVTKPSEKVVVDALLTEDGPKAASLYRKQLSEYPDPQLDDISRSRLAAYERTMATPAKPPMNASKLSVSTVRLPAATGKRPDTVSRQPQAPQPAASAAAKKPDSVSRQPKAPASKPAAAMAATQAQQASKAPASQAAPAAPKPAAGGGFTLQFGSFDSTSNAEQLVAQLAPGSPAKIVSVNGVYKVRLKRSFATREEAGAFRRSLPIESFVVTDQP